MIKIFCINCKKHIYNTDEVKSGMIPLSSDFKPASEEIPKPEPCSHMLCPFCGNYFMKIDIFGCSTVLTDKGYLPK